MKRTYIDWAAAAPVSRAAERSFARLMKTYGNPSSPHEEGREAHTILEDARVRIARLAGVKSDAVIFTGGATEANALAIVGQVAALIDSGRSTESIHVLYTPSAHASTRGAISMLKERGVTVEALAVLSGKIDLTTLAQQIRPETVLIALDVVCGETGTRFDTRAVRQVLDKARGGLSPRIRIHADASQLPLVESFELTRIAADTMTLDAQKVGGVRGIGVLLSPRHIPTTPLMLGGGQERGMRPGTPSPALAASFAAALEECNKTHVVFAQKASAMRELLLAAIVKNISGAMVNCGKVHVPHILNVSFMGRDTDYLAVLMDEAGFAVSTRSACATDEEGSVAVLAFTGEPVRASSTLRISWGPQTHERDLERFADSLIHAVRFLDGNTL
jgi:cysteine desulfurase